MSMVRLECYCPTREGGFNRKALCVVFATKCPLTVYFQEDYVVAFNDNGLLYGLRGTRARYLEAIGAADMEELELSQFELKLEAVIKRRFEPAHLHIETPPDIVADWLQDRGMDRVAAIVRHGALTSEETTLLEETFELKERVLFARANNNPRLFSDEEQEESKKKLELMVSLRQKLLAQ